LSQILSSENRTEILSEDVAETGSQTSGPPEIGNNEIIEETNLNLEDEIGLTRRSRTLC